METTIMRDQKGEGDHPQNIGGLSLDSIPAGKDGLENKEGVGAEVAVDDPQGQDSQAQ